MFLSRSKQILVFLAVILVWGAAPIVVLLVHGDWPESAGEYGDLFGGVGALFSGLAFAGLIGTLVMQREALTKQSEELALTRDSVEQQTKELSLSSEALQLQVDEMKAQRAEMEASRDTLAKQQEVMAKQAFEGTFFQMLKLWNDRVGELSVNGHSGRDAFKKTLGLKNYHRFLSGVGDLAKNEAAEKFSTEFPSEFQTYFMLLYNLIAFVDNAPLLEAEKKSYVRLIRAHLVDDEMAVLLYNCVGAKGRGLGVLAYKYQLFRYLLPETKKTHAKAWDLFRSEFGRKAA